MECEWTSALQLENVGLGSESVDDLLGVLASKATGVRSGSGSLGAAGERVGCSEGIVQ